jgi:FixJ family two-component response regulator
MHDPFPSIAGAQVPARFQAAGLPVIVLVDDDDGVRSALDSLLRSAGFRTRSHDSAASLLKAGLPAAEHCVLLDVGLPDMNGFDLHARLEEAGNPPPVIFMTGNADVPMGIRAMKTGAVDFLVKPFDDDALLAAVDVALARGHAERCREAKRATMALRYAQLTRRERQVMALVAQGLMNKQVAAELGLREITVKLHRSRLMRKMELRSLAELVRVSDLLDPPAID